MNDDEIKKYVREHYSEVAIGKKVHQPARENKAADCCATQEESC